MDAYTWMARRELIRLAGAAAASGMLGTNMSSFAIDRVAEQAPGSRTPPTIEPSTIKRRSVGLRGYDPERAFTGFALFSPLPTTNKTVYVVDMLGNVVHTWNMPYPPGQSGYLTERGTLFYNGQIPNESHVGKAPYRGGAALEMDWKGRILWGVNHPDHAREFPRYLYRRDQPPNRRHLLEARRASAF